MIAVIDYETSSTQSLMKALGELGIDARLAAGIDDVQRAPKIILPAGDSYPKAARWLRDGGLVPPLLRAVDERRRVLGIGLGLHLLLDVSHEDGLHTGLGLLHGKAARLDPGDHPAARRFVLPHVGWNQVNWSSDCPLLAGIQSGEYFFFNHSYHAEPLDVRCAAGRCNHGVEFVAVLWSDCVMGVQFLPEKSGAVGRQVLRNFAAV